MLITLSVGVGLEHMNEGNKSIRDEQFIFQSSMVLHDVLNILKTSPELEQVSSAVDMSNFLLSSEVIPFESNGVQVIIKISSARSKINPHAFKQTLALDSFHTFLMRKGVNLVYASLLVDSMNGFKDDGSYQTDIFNKKPNLFREYISSDKHLKSINSFYMDSYHDSSIKNLKTEDFLYMSKDTNNSVDLNFATALTYELLLGCDEFRAQELSLDESIYETLEDLRLSEDEKINISKFKTSFFEAYLYVEVEVIQKDKTAKIRFEYNVKSKKGAEFVFEV
jgi:hypothetical protein